MVLCRLGREKGECVAISLQRLARRGAVILDYLLDVEGSSLVLSDGGGRKYTFRRRIILKPEDRF
jgi:hypothetical protein